MKNKVKFIGNGDDRFKNEVHFLSPYGSDYTLCGLTLDGDPITCGQFKETNEKINCENCQKIIDFSKEIKKTW